MVPIFALGLVSGPVRGEPPYPLRLPPAQKVGPRTIKDPPDGPPTSGGPSFLGSLREQRSYARLSVGGGKPTATALALSGPEASLTLSIRASQKACGEGFAR